jgi:glutaredoxin
VKGLILKTPNHPGKASRGIVNLLTCGALCFSLLTSATTQAQTVYRIVGADGRITFSDKAPGTADTATVMVPGGNNTSPSAAPLPLELRQVAGRFPVTLYTSSNCAPCVSGRKLLEGRGIPFSERTVTTSEDAEALLRISGASSLPLLTIGSQQIKGYSESEWTQFLDAANYPKSSVLPAGYRALPATPLVVTQAAVPAAKVEEVPPAASPPAEPVQPPANPAGIRF